MATEPVELDPREGLRWREVPVSLLQEWPENPRRIRDDRLEDLKRSLTADPRMLYARPLLALPDGTVFAGNQRLRAVRELGWEAVPVATVDLDYDSARLWALRDNNQYGDWDERALASLLADLQTRELDLALTGFASSDLDSLLRDLVTSIDPDEVPPLPLEPQSRPGEIYQLGCHRLLCGDATDPSAVAELRQGESAEVMWTDPPYGVDYTGKTRAQLTIANDAAAALGSLLGGAFAVADTALAGSGRFYVAAPAGPQGTEFRLAIKRVGWHFHQSLAWVKNAPVLGHSDHHYQHEDILYGWKPGPGRPGRGRHRGTRWYGDNSQTSVFFYDRPTRSSDHPTVKPVALVAAQLKNSSRRGDTIYDPFAGSGTTLIACEQLGRRCLAVELDPRYCDVIRRRYQELANAQA